MASIERTAYPRFKAALSAQELQTLYAPTEEEREFVAIHARTDTQQLTLLTLLKCHQSLGSLPAFEAIPAFIRPYLCQQLHLPPETAFHTAKNLRSRSRHLIRGSLAVTAYANGGARLVEQHVTQAASTMSDPADLINVAIEHLMQQRFELPAFQTLDRVVSHVRYEVHQTLYTQMTAALSEAEKTRLDALISVHTGRSEFTRIKDTPRRATLKHLRQWTERLTWLEAILAPQAFLRGIAHTKIQQFAAEAAALDLGDIRAILHGPRRWGLLLCFLHHAQVQTRDQLVDMLLKRMRHTTTAAQERLKELHEQHRELEEQMLAVFSEVLDHTIDIPEDEEATLGHRVRQLLKTHGGAEALRERYEQVSAYHHDNYRPLLWGFYRPYRAALFRLSHLLTFRSATHQHALLDALAFMQRFQHARGDSVPAEIALDFASVRWQALIRTQRRLKTVFKRRALEVCVFSYLDAGLRYGDGYVEGSEAYADYRQQLLPWDQCVPRFPAYCQALQLASTATEFVAALRERLREVAQRVDAAYPANTALTLDEDGTPHLKRLPAQPVPDDLATLEALLKARLPQTSPKSPLHMWIGEVP